jgi:hypothetical protein
MYRPRFATGKTSQDLRRPLPADSNLGAEHAIPKDVREASVRLAEMQGPYAKRGERGKYVNHSSISFMDQFASDFCRCR